MALPITRVLLFHLLHVLKKFNDDNWILINKCSLFILIASPIDFQGRINLNDIFTIL